MSLYTKTKAIYNCFYSYSAALHWPVGFNNISHQLWSSGQWRAAENLNNSCGNFSLSLLAIEAFTNTQYNLQLH